MSDRSDESEAADESSSCDDDAACRGEPKDRGVLGPLRGGGPRGEPHGVERDRGVTGPLLRGDAAGRRRRQTRVATGATYMIEQGGRSTAPRAPGSRTWQSSVPSARFTTRSSRSTRPNGDFTGHLSGNQISNAPVFAAMLSS